MKKKTKSVQPKLETLWLGKHPLTLEEVEQVAFGLRKVALSRSAIARIERSHDFLKKEASRGDVIYGLNTGFGLLSNVRIPDEDIETLQLNFLRSHAAGVGPALPDFVVRAMLLLRAATLTRGHSGVQLSTVRQVIALINKGVFPIVPEQGSVGASGDLAPLAHLALVLIGEGKARVKGKVVSGAHALEMVGLKPIRLAAKEGLALTNGTQFMSAIGTLALLEAERLAKLADVAGALTTEAMQGTSAPFDKDLHAVRPHPGQVAVAANLRRLLLAGGKSQISKSHENCGRVQDPYSLRCMPQVHGSSRDVMAYVRQVLECEINSVTDNPLIFPKEKKIVSGGNFHGQYVSMAMDMLAIATAELGSISERRIDKLVNPVFSGLPAFLVQEGGLNSGFMILQYAAAAVVSENKTLCHPAVVDSIPTCADKEDHVSMGAWGARKAAMVVLNVRRVLAMELMAAAQGIDFLRPLKSTGPLERAHRIIRREVTRLDRDRVLHDDVMKVDALIANGAFSKI